MVNELKVQVTPEFLFYGFINGSPEFITGYTAGYT
ncbi:hypothetical protein SAMN06296241_1567 [Salinimicrobium sediminis]|uniref:Uncharacterized protein n=1 Tax=Salinimicrobium sediminis TaxID=1343891 RepID=A0A285X5G4_9FLAO|nr:hypothetical protein SAMN06296241_1567 [Salinimicrobium sediminis]